MKQNLSDVSEFLVATEETNMLDSDYEMKIRSSPVKHMLPEKVSLWLMKQFVAVWQ